MTRPEHEADALLMRALLADDDLAVQAAREWVDAVVLDDLDPARHRAVPLVYRTLLDAGMAGDLPGRVKGSYRQAWARNHLRASALCDLVGALERGGIPSIVVKGMALVDYYGERWGARDMHDADLLVPHEHASRAIDLLGELGWHADHAMSTGTLRARLLSHRGGWAFVGPHDLEIDLHWHLFHTSLGARADDDVWAAAEAFVLSGQELRRPHPGDLVLHACEQGSGLGDAAGSRFVSAADVRVLASACAVDRLAPRIVEQARRHSLLTRTQTFLSSLAEAGATDDLVDLARRVGDHRPARMERALGRRSTEADTATANLLASMRRQGGGRTRFPAVLRGVVRERVEPALTRRRLSTALYVLTGRRARVARGLRRLDLWSAETVAGRPPPISLGDKLDFTVPGTVDWYGGPGWSFTDPRGTWTDGAEARVILPLPADAPDELAISVDAWCFAVPASPKRVIEVRADDRVIGRVALDLARYVQPPYVFRFTRDRRRTGRPLEVSFVVHRPVTPATLGLSSDGRRVGLQLRSLWVLPAAHEAVRQLA